MDELPKRSDDGFLLGVCGGLAKHYNRDPFITRIFTVFLALLALEFVLVFYIILAVLMDSPSEENDDEPEEDFKQG